MSDAAEVFAEIYETKAWGEGSGGGSTPELIPEYIALVNWWVEELWPDQVLDIGSGVGWVAGAVNWQKAYYIGMDCVPDVVRQARLNVGGQFVVGDATKDPLPSADLVLLKEVTQHLDNASIFDLIGNLKKFQRVLHTSVETDNMNADIPMGQTRGVDLSLPPFNLKCETVLRYELPGVKYFSQLWRPS